MAFQSLPSTSSSLGRFNLLAPTLFCFLFIAPIDKTTALRHQTGVIVPSADSVKSTRSLCSHLFPWLPLLSILLMLVLSAYALKRTLQRLPMAAAARQIPQADHRHRYQIATGRTIYRTALHTVVPLASLTLLDSRLSSGARLTLLIGGPVLIVCLSPRLSFNLPRHAWCLAFLMSGSLLVYSLLWLALYILFGIDGPQAQALLPATCSGFVWLNHMLVARHYLSSERLDTYMPPGLLVVEQHGSSFATVFELFQEQSAIWADIQEQRHGTRPVQSLPGVRQPAQAHRPLLRGNGPQLHDGRRLGNRQAGRNMLNDLLLRGTVYAAGQR